MDDSIERLGFELSTRALAEQERALTALRSRAATVLATASVSGSLASAGMSRASLDLFGGLAMLAFVLTLLGSLWILLPHELGFSVRGWPVVDRSALVSAPDLIDVYRQTAAWINDRVRENQTTLRELAVWLTVSCLLLSVEIVLFGLDLVR
ncbi:MAG TPA: hypothetical protein VMB05_07210 [Solirubrobacteraceae bacterium]|nr:hypothetical protein [Solirubrobacteraceae bacterium]